MNNMVIHLQVCLQVYKLLIAIHLQPTNVVLSDRFPHTKGTRMTLYNQSRYKREYIGASKNHIFFLLELARIATLWTTKEITGEIDALGWFFGTFTLVAMEHVSVDTLLLSETSDMLVVKADGFSLICHGPESGSCIHLGLGPFTSP